MCVVSNVGDFYSDKWRPLVGPQDQGGKLGGLAEVVFSGVPRAEFEQLKREVMEMKDLLIKAKEIDQKTSQPDCEKESKLKILRAVAEAVGISLDDIFPKEPAR